MSGYSPLSRGWLESQLSKRESAQECVLRGFFAGKPSFEPPSRLFF